MARRIYGRRGLGNILVWRRRKPPYPRLDLSACRRQRIDRREPRTQHTGAIRSAGAGPGAGRGGGALRSIRKGRGTMPNRRKALIFFVAGVIGGCHAGVKPLAPGSPLSGKRVQVQEFTIADGAVTRYNAPTDTMGLEIAQKLTKFLRQGGVDAEAIPQGARPVSPIVIEGGITRLDGGNRALRYFAGFGAGAAHFAAQAKVHGSAADLLGEFSDQCDAA